MEATAFDEENTVLDPPNDLSAEECDPLSVWCGRLGDEDGSRSYAAVVSCWKVTAEELEEIKRTKRVWLTIMGDTMQPAYVSGVSPFKREEGKVESFADIGPSTDRLVVQYHCANGQENFGWGVTGKIPLLSLIGAVSGAQAWLEHRHVAEDEVCPLPALVITWDDVTKRFRRFVNPGIPVEALIGMLEVIKATLTRTKLAQAQANQQMILGPDGRPIPR